MSPPKFLKQAFVGGEIAPEMQGRGEDVAYDNGVATCRNFLIRPQGAVDNRAGLRFVREVKDSTKRVRLIPFTFSGEQTMVIELGEKYARFHTDAATVMNGAEPYEIETPYLAAHLMDIHHVQSADILTLVHPDYPPQELRRYGVTDWRLQPIAFNPDFAAPANLAVNASRVPQASGVVQINLQYRYKVTAVKDKVESKPSEEVTTTNDLYTSGNKNTLSWNAVAGVDSYYVYKYQSGMYGYIGQTQDTRFEDTGVAPDMAKTPPQYKDIFNKADHYPSAVSYHQQRRVGKFVAPALKLRKGRRAEIFERFGKFFILSVYRALQALILIFDRGADFFFLAASDHVQKAARFGKRGRHFFLPARKFRVHAVRYFFECGLRLFVYVVYGLDKTVFLFRKYTADFFALAAFGFG